MRDRLIQLIKEARKHAKGAICDIERIMLFADYLLANGVIVPPCKVGDTVYVLANVIWYDECCHCANFRIGGMGDPRECARTKGPFKHPDYTEITEWIATEKNIYTWLAYGDFGKTVFFAREEAEKALKGGVQE